MSTDRFQRVNVEITNRCNGHCGFCPGGGPLARPPRSMSVDEFRGIVRQLAPLTDEVVPHLLGEPLMHPDFGDILGVAREEQVPINIVTNATLWDEQRLKWLLDKAVRQVSLSLQARPGGNHMDEVIAFCERAEHERPDLYINIRLWNQPDAVLRHASVDAVIKNAITRRWGLDWDSLALDVRRRNNVPLRGRQYLHFNTTFDWPDMSHPAIHTEGVCPGLSQHFGILSDGTVVPCCLDHAGIMNLGNAFGTSLDDILKGDRARLIFEGFRSGRLVEPLCQRCQFIKRFNRRPHASNRRP